MVGERKIGIFWHERKKYFSNTCNEVIENPFKYIRILDEFWGNDKIQYFFSPFNKYSNLHMFIEFSIDRLFYESNKQFDELSIEELLNKDFFINNALNYHNIKHESFNDWYKNNKRIDSYSDDSMYRYLASIEFSEEYLKLKDQIIEEIFFILFMNRKFLKEFNLNLASVFEISDTDDFNIDTKYYLKKNKTLLRKNIPIWAKKSVFYRDRGICVFCKKDLSGLLNISNKYHIDHIVPLAKFGLNDVLNLQLLCETCNTSKGCRNMETSLDYEKWY